MLLMLRMTICSSAALAALAMGQRPPPTMANASYPLAIKTRWTYEMVQEFSPGVRPSELDAALMKGNRLETTLVSEVAGTDLIAGARYARVESRHDGRLWLTEWLRVTPEGLFLAKTTEDGKETVITPPQKMISAHMTGGETWSWKASDAPVTMRTVVVGRESSEVPAGTFDATKMVHDIRMVLPQAKIRASNSRWFSPGVGYVRQESEVYAGERLLTRTKLSLIAFGAAQSPGVAGAAAAFQPAHASATEKYEARWDVQNSGVTDQLNSVYFIDVNTGWAAGTHNTILKTTDGGKTWNRLLERIEGGNAFSSIYFTNGKEGWASSDKILLHSSDGGETWRPASPLPEGKSLGTGGAFGGIRVQTGLFGTSDRFYRSGDGGTTWTTSVSKLPRNDFEAFFVLDEQHMWGAGDNGRYALTADGGRTWQEPTIPVKTKLTKVYFVSPKIGWILPTDHNGGPLASTDGGLTWTSQYTGADRNTPLRDIHFVNERDGFLLVGGSNRSDIVYRTSDGGTRWTTIGQLPERRTAMSFPAVDNGWVVGPTGYVVHYHLVPMSRAKPTQ